MQGYGTSTVHDMSVCKGRYSQSPLLLTSAVHEKNDIEMEEAESGSKRARESVEPHEGLEARRFRKRGKSINALMP